MIFRISVLSLLSLLTISIATSAQSINYSDFKDPPTLSKLHTWWHWMDGNITKEGITKDLEEMRDHGVVEATIINIGKIYSRDIDLPHIKFNSPEWIEMYRWALKEANRLGISVGIQTIDGYCTTGGPWITPELSMKQYVWTKTSITGGKKIRIQLEKPTSLKNYYSDVSVIAYPSKDVNDPFINAHPKTFLNGGFIGSAIADGNPTTEVNLTRGDIIQWEFKYKYPTDKITLLPHLPFSWDDMSNISASFSLYYSEDGKTYNKIEDLNFVGVNKIIVAKFRAVEAKYFRLELVKNNLLYSTNYPVSEIELLSGNQKPSFNPFLSSFFEKTASVFDVREHALDDNVKRKARSIAENSVVDISKFVSPDGVLNWRAPKGDWQVIRFGFTTTGVTNNPASPEGLGLEADKMDTTAINVHINSYAKKLIDAAGPFKGTTLKFLLMDSWEAQFQTWTRTFAEEFKKRRGYNLTPWIPVLCGQLVGSPSMSEAFLHDFRKTISDLIDERYYKHFSDLCHRNGMEFHGEVIYSNWGAYPPLDPLRSNQYVDIPMTEFWSDQNSNEIPEYKPTTHVKPGFPMYAAEAFGKQIIGSEAYTGFAHYSETPADLKPFGDAAFCSGVNQMVLHSFVLQPFDKKPGMTLGKFGAHFNRNNPIWEFNKGWIDYQSRVQYVLQKGFPFSDVVFFIGDQLPQFFDHSFLNDLPFGYSATSCNADMLYHRARVINGNISFGGNQLYPLLMLQNSNKMDYKTLVCISKLVKRGAKVFGPKPTEMLSVLDLKNNMTQFRNLVDAVWGKKYINRYGKGTVYSGQAIGAVLENLKLLPDLTANSLDPKDLMYIHKKIDQEEVYFVFNQQNKSLNKQIKFRLTNAQPEIWNPETGNISTPAIYAVDSGQTTLPVTFGPYESRIFIFKKNVGNHFIKEVFSEGKKIFPLNRLDDSLSIIPQVFIKGDSMEGEYKSSNNLLFRLNTGQLINKRLIAPLSYSLGDFSTRLIFNSISHDTISPLEIKKLKYLTEFDNPSIKFFAGKVNYITHFKLPDDTLIPSDSVMLDIGELGGTAEVKLNGRVIANVWHSGTIVPLNNLLTNENELEITVAVICRNRFIGDLRQYGKIKSLWTTAPIETILDKNMPLRPTGLSGPLRLIIYKHEVL